LPVRKRANGEGSISYVEDKKLWKARVTLSIHPGTGKLTRRTVYGKTQKEVTVKLAAMRRAQEDGTLRSPDKTTVRDWSVDWLAHAQGSVKASTHQGYSSDVRRYVLPHIGAVRLDKLSAREVQVMLTELGKLHRPRIVQWARALTNMMMNHALRLGVLTRNPVELTKGPKMPRQKMRFWQPDEARAFLKHVEGHRLEALFYLALVTGMRKSELLGLRWADLERETLSVRQTVTLVNNVAIFGPPKTDGSARTLLITPDVLAQLAARRIAFEAERSLAGADWQEHDLVFGQSTGAAMLPWSLDYHWTEQRRTSGVKPIRFHDLRHTYATLAIAQGLDIRLVADRLGHAHPSITLNIYSHVLDDQRKRAAISLKGLLGSPTRRPMSTETDKETQAQTSEKAG